MSTAALTLAVLAFYAFFYRAVVRHWGPGAEAVVDRLGLSATRSAREIAAVGKLAAAGVAQALFAVGLLFALDVDVGGMVHLDPALIGLGALLGLGEIGLASFLGTVAVRLELLRRPRANAEDWIAQGRGGWMGYFGATVAAAPAWFALASISLYVAGEELVFRGIVIDTAGTAGAGVAISLSVVLFVAVQAFNMPSLRAATFPIVGALVVGLVHGVLFWQTHDIVPLTVAHVTYFLGALALSPSARPIAAVP